MPMLMKSEVDTEYRIEMNSLEIKYFGAYATSDEQKNGIRIEKVNGIEI